MRTSKILSTLQGLGILWDVDGIGTVVFLSADAVSVQALVVRGIDNVWKNFNWVTRDPETGNVISTITKRANQANPASLRACEEALGASWFSIAHPAMQSVFDAVEEIATNKQIVTNALSGNAVASQSFANLINRLGF